MTVLFLKKQGKMKNLSENKLSVIKKVYDLCPNALLTGSISLTHYGIIDRPIGDIDLVVGNAELSTVLSGLEDVIDHSWSEIDAEDETAISYRAETGGEYVCIFVADGQDFVRAKINGIEVNISDPKYTIEAKRKYVEFADELLKKNIGGNSFLRKTAQYRQKHLFDIEAYEKWMGNFI